MYSNSYSFHITQEVKRYLTMADAPISYNAPGPKLALVGFSLQTFLKWLAST